MLDITYDAGAKPAIANPTPPTNWRDVLPVHPAAEKYPRMGSVELTELGNDIKTHGLKVPIVIWFEPDGRYSLLDGISRLDAMKAVGIEFELVKDGTFFNIRIRDDGLAPKIAQPEYASASMGVDPDELAASLNAHRRHLTHEAKRKAIESQLKAHPEKSDRQIAEAVKASPTTVASVRKSNVQLGHKDRKEDTGRKARGRKPGAAAPKVSTTNGDMLGAPTDKPASEPEPTSESKPASELEPTSKSKPASESEQAKAVETPSVDVDAIATLGRAILALLNSPSVPNVPNVEAAKEKATKIVRLADPSGNGKNVKPKYKGRLDPKLFGKGLCLTPAAPPVEPEPAAVVTSALATIIRHIGSQQDGEHIERLFDDVIAAKPDFDVNAIRGLFTGLQSFFNYWLRHNREVAKAATPPTSGPASTTTPPPSEPASTPPPSEPASTTTTPPPDSTGASALAAGKADAKEPTKADAPPPAPEPASTTTPPDSVVANASATGEEPRRMTIPELEELEDKYPTPPLFSPVEMAKADG